MSVALVRLPQDTGQVSTYVMQGSAKTVRFYQGLRHAHDFHQVTLLLSAPRSLSWLVNNEARSAKSLSKGELVICPANVPTSVTATDPFDAISVRLSRSLVDRVSRQTGRTGFQLRPMVGTRDPFLETLAEKLAEDVGSECPVLSESLGTALAVHLLREYADFSAPTRSITELSQDDLDDVLRYIDTHLAEKLSLEELAARTSLSSHHFLRKFRAATGLTPRQYVIQCRVVRAKEMLQRGIGITETALTVGFSSQSHLHQHVRNLLGVTPGELARPLPPT
ncbi:AraC family transcriptional regulator [Bremerella sp. JC817]|uniref:AraC family transcriptional regulator n=1 Tax=Bremerella sp. JC817 TaxID=3231756 RepID=UPI003457AD07